LFSDGLGSGGLWIAACVAEIRSGFNGFAARVPMALEEDVFSGYVFVFRGWRGEMTKALWWRGGGVCLLVTRLERCRFIWPQATNGKVPLSQAQPSMLFEGIDRRRPECTWEPSSAL
jgi:transposase